jgi:hypothetical protein
MTDSKMKNDTIFRLVRVALAILLVVTVASGCGNDPQKKGPRETADAFMTALQFGDYDKAKTYCSPGTASNLDMMASMAKLGANPFAGEFTMKEVKEDGDYATVIYDQGGNPGKVIQLRKEEGKWLVLASKTGGGATSDSDTEDVDTDSDEAEKEPKVDPADKYKSFRDGKDARQTAESFMEGIEYDDYDAAMRYGSEATNEVLDFQKGMSALDSDKKKHEKAVIVKVEETGEHAKVYYHEGKDKHEKELKLGKDKHGNWQVIMSKSDFKENEGDKPE